MSDPVELDPARAYDLWSESYDARPNPMVALSERALEALTPRPDAILELGCGTGRNLLALARRGARDLAGVDLSEGMLDVARRRLPGATLRRQDARDAPPVDHGSRDLVLVSLVLEHLEDPAPVFSRAAAALANHGVLLVLELHPDAFDAGSRARFELEDGSSAYIAAHRHDEAELDAHALAAGFAPGAFLDLHPDPELRAAFTSTRRPPGTPWLLRGEWRLAGA